MGNFYGTTSLAGSGGLGTAYKLNPSGAVVLQYNFLGGTDGANPYAGVILTHLRACFVISSGSKPRVNSRRHG